MNELLSVPDGDLRWYCLRARPRQEHLAAERLRAQYGVEVYGPRIRYRKVTRRGTVWFVEALFPGYLFARFDAAADLRRVQYAAGVTGVVRFSGKPAVVPEETIANLRSAMSDGEIKVFVEPFKAGDRVEVVEGPFRGLEAVITQVLPARERVRVLLEFLGRETAAEISYAQLAKPSGHPLAIPAAADSSAAAAKRR